jgi:hypothetical protein
MIDNVNPTSQFHPYQPPPDVPHRDRPRSSLSKARTFARKNGGILLGGLAALVIGAGLMRKRTITPP